MWELAVRKSTCTGGVPPVILNGFSLSRVGYTHSLRHSRGEETQLSSGWTLIGSELSSPNFNSSVRAEHSFVIRYLDIVIKPLCGNLDICLNY